MGIKDKIEKLKKYSPLDEPLLPTDDSMSFAMHRVGKRLTYTEPGYPAAI